MKSFFSIVCSKKVKYSLLLIILLCFYTFLCAISYATTVSSNISNSVFRLHVIANSDSEEDQNLKYIVRDALLDYMNSLTASVTSKEEAISIAKEHEQDFLKIAQDTVYEHGYDYMVNVEIGNFSFPTKYYGDISLPAGYYDALRVTIGEAKGQNWWCVMFPPLCFVNISSGVVDENSKEMMREELSNEEYSLISDNNSHELKLKFKLIEWLQNSNFLTANK